MTIYWNTHQHQEIYLRSADQRLLHVPQSNLVSRGDCAFAVAAPQLLNALPLVIRTAPDLVTFKRELKSHMCRELDYWDVLKCCMIRVFLCTLCIYIACCLWCYPECLPLSPGHVFVCLLLSFGTHALGNLNSCNFMHVKINWLWLWLKPSNGI